MVASRGPTARRVVVGTVLCAVIGLQLYRQGSGTTRLYQGISSVSVDSGAGLPPEETEAVGLATAASAPAALPPTKPAAAAKNIVSRGAAAKLTASPPTPAHAVPMASPPPPCLSRSCTKRLSALEPAWVDLRFQPRIDWAAGGVRGDCVVGEYEYTASQMGNSQAAH